MQGDCLELLKDIPDGSVDMVLTDPPYSSGGMYRSDRASGSSKNIKVQTQKTSSLILRETIETSVVLRFGKRFGFLPQKEKCDLAASQSYLPIGGSWQRLLTPCSAVDLCTEVLFRGLKLLQGHKKGGLHKTQNIAFGHQMGISQMRSETTRDILSGTRQQHLNGCTQLKSLSSCWSI